MMWVYTLQICKKKKLCQYRKWSGEKTRIQSIYSKLNPKNIGTVPVIKNYRAHRDEASLLWDHFYNNYMKIIVINLY